MKAAWAIFRKDLRIEWRSRERVLARGLCSLLAVMVFHFALPGGATAGTQRYAPRLLWATYLFSALFGLGRGEDRIQSRPRGSGRMRRATVLATSSSRTWMSATLG